MNADQPARLASVLTSQRMVCALLAWAGTARPFRCGPKSRLRESRGPIRAPDRRT